MDRQPRSRSAIIVSALVFGSIASPFFYLARSWGASYTVEFLVPTVPLLTACVAFLLLVLTRQSESERRLCDRLGKAFAPLFYFLLFGAFLVTGAILASVADFSLLTAVEYWYYLTIIFGICATGALVAVIVAPPSRLESAVQCRLTAAGPTRVYWRILVYGALLTLLLLCTSAVYRKLAHDAVALEQIGWHDKPDFRNAMEDRQLC